jgi:hypothetical protein
LNASSTIETDFEAETVAREAVTAVGAGVVGVGAGCAGVAGAALDCASLGWAGAGAAGGVLGVVAPGSTPVAGLAVGLGCETASSPAADAEIAAGATSAAASTTASASGRSLLVAGARRTIRDRTTERRLWRFDPTLSRGR